MSGLFGGGGTVNESARISNLRIQTSCYGVAIPVVLGEQRCTGNLLNYGDLRAIKHKTKSGGKGGGGFTNVSYGYRYSLQVGICEGPVTVGEVWMQLGSDKIALSQTDKYGYTIYSGGTPPEFSAILEEQHPDMFFRYPGLANLTAIDLGEFTSDSAPGFSFEVRGFGYDADIAGADPADAITRIITDVRWGAAAPVAYFPAATNYGDYAVAMNWPIGLEMSEQKTAAEWVQAILDQTNAAAVWAADHLTVVPYGDQAVSGNGRSWTPNVTPIFDLTDDDYLGEQDEPVRVTRQADSESWNIQSVEFRNRENGYNIEVIEGSDPASVAMFGPKKNSDTLLAHGLCNADAVGRLADIVVRRKCRTRNTYEFTLPWTYCMLLPMDIVTLTDAALEMERHPVRITRVVETASLEIQCEAEDYPAGAGHAALVQRESASGWVKDANADPGDCHPPIVFDAPVGLCDSANRELWIGTCGGADWGGASVWISDDGLTYSRVGVIDRALRQGVLTDTLLAVADPDNSSTLSVALLSDEVELVGSTDVSAARLATLCRVGDEFISFASAELVAPGAYDLSRLRRGALNSVIAQHNAGAQFARIDREAFFRYTYATDQAPETLYIKLTSFNLYGAAEQTLDAVDPTLFVRAAVAPARYDAWMPVPINPQVFATPDSIGHISRARMRLSFNEGTSLPVSGVLVFMSAFPYENTLTVALGGTSGTLTIAGTSVLQSGAITVRAGSTPGRIIATTWADPFDVTVNHGGRFWAQLPGGEWRKCVGIDEIAYLFDPPHDVTPVEGMTMVFAEIAWADSRQDDEKLALLTDGSAYEIIRWQELDQDGPTGAFRLLGCERGAEGTTPISADGKALHYYPAPGPGTVVARFPAECFSHDGGLTFSGEADIDLSIPAGYYATCSVAVYATLPDGGHVRSRIVPVSYGGPL